MIISRHHWLLKYSVEGEPIWKRRPNVRVVKGITWNSCSLSCLIPITQFQNASHHRWRQTQFLQYQNNRTRQPWYCFSRLPHQFYPNNAWYEIIAMICAPRLGCFSIHFSFFSKNKYFFFSCFRSIFSRFSFPCERFRENKIQSSEEFWILSSDASSPR